jgi:two-component system, OmpR family, response regulator ChvI
MATIAIVDDEKNILVSLRSAFAARGHLVETFDDPLAALPRLISVPPRVLILNGRMPGLHGVDFFLKFRSHCPAPVIFLSASACEIEDSLDAIGVPASAYVDKPFS